MVWSMVRNKSMGIIWLWLMVKITVMIKVTIMVMFMVMVMFIVMDD